MFYVSLTVITKQEPVKDTQHIKIRHNTTENLQFTKEESRKNGTNEIQKNQKTISKIGMSTYISIITLNVNGFSDQIEWVNGF